MKVIYHEAARTDLIRQFRYYLVNRDLPEIASRFKDAVKRTVREVSLHPQIGAPVHSRNLHLQGLRAWPVQRFPAIRVYFVVEKQTLKVLRILHGKQNVRKILEKLV